MKKIIVRKGTRFRKSAEIIGRVTSVSEAYMTCNVKYSNKEKIVKEDIDDVIEMIKDYGRV